MPQKPAFGRRPQAIVTAAPVSAAVSPAPAAAAPPPIEEAIRAALIIDDPVDHEVEHWNAVRKARKRSFREPWRSFAIGTTTIFGFSMWLLPDSVAEVVQLLTFALTVASIWAGFRKPLDDEPSAG